MANVISVPVIDELAAKSVLDGGCPDLDLSRLRRSPGTASASPRRPHSERGVALRRYRQLIELQSIERTRNSAYLVKLHLPEVCSRSSAETRKSASEGSKKSLDNSSSRQRLPDTSDDTTRRLRRAGRLAFLRWEVAVLEHFGQEGKAKAKALVDPRSTGHVESLGVLAEACSRLGLPGNIAELLWQYCLEQSATVVLEALAHGNEHAPGLQAKVQVETLLSGFPEPTPRKPIVKLPPRQPRRVDSKGSNGNLEAAETPRSPLPAEHGKAAAPTVPAAPNAPAPTTEREEVTSTRTSLGSRTAPDLAGVAAFAREKARSLKTSWPEKALPNFMRATVASEMWRSEENGLGQTPPSSRPRTSSSHTEVAPLVRGSAASLPLSELIRPQSALPPDHNSTSKSPPNSDATRVDSLQALPSPPPRAEKPQRTWRMSAQAAAPGKPRASSRMSAEAAAPGKPRARSRSRSRVEEPAQPAQPEQPAAFVFDEPVRQPLVVRLPAWHPESPPFMPPPTPSSSSTAAPSSKGAAELAEAAGFSSESDSLKAPVPLVCSLGPRRISVRWMSPREHSSSISWRLRLRREGIEEWRDVDLERGTVITSDLEAKSWTRRAFYVHLGMHVLTYVPAGDGGHKSASPRRGIVVGVCPGRVEVQLGEPGTSAADGTSLATVPPEWVLKAYTAGAPSREGEIAPDDSRSFPALGRERSISMYIQEHGLDDTAARWRFACNCVLQRVQQRLRERKLQRAILWTPWFAKAEEGSRVAFECLAMPPQSFPPPRSAPGEAGGGGLRAASPSSSAAPAACDLRTWWPALLLARTVSSDPSTSPQPPAARSSSRKPTTGRVARSTSRGPTIARTEGDTTSDASAVAASVVSAPGSPGRIHKKRTSFSASVLHGDAHLKVPPVPSSPSAAPEASDLQLVSDPVEISKPRPAVLEPWPRTQVVPREWLFEQLPSAQQAASNLCVGQLVLCHYWTGDCRPPAPGRRSVSPVRRPTDASSSEVPGSDVTLPQWVSDWLTAIFHTTSGVFSSRRSERAVRGKVTGIYVAPSQVEVRCMPQAITSTTRKPKSFASLLTRVVAISLPLPKDAGPAKEEISPVPAPKARSKAASPNLTMLRVERWNIFAVSQEEFWHFRCVATTTDGKEVELVAGTSVQFDDEDSEVAGTQSTSVGQVRPLRRRKTVEVATVQAVNLHWTHLQIVFEERLPLSALVPASSCAARLDCVGGPLQLRQPEVVVECLPDDIDHVEVSVGIDYSLSTGGHDSVMWGPASTPCLVPPLPPQQPLPPAAYALSSSMSAAEVSWLAPKEPPALAFSLQVRQVDAPGSEWEYLGLHGNPVPNDDVNPWEVVWIPLQAGAYVAAYAEEKGKKAVVPTRARILRGAGVGEAALEVEFEPPFKELRLLSSEPKYPGRISSKASADVEAPTNGQAIPIRELGDRVDCAWAEDGTRGTPLAIFHEQDVLLTQVDTKPLRYCIRLAGEEASLPRVKADGAWMRSTEAQRIGCSTYSATVCRGAVTVEGLRAEASYEFRLRLKTSIGWSSWSKPNLLEMPRMGYTKESAPDEVQRNAFYKADLLVLAVNRNERCWECIADALGPGSDRLVKLEAAVARNLNGAVRANPKLSRKLVDMSGPLRECQPHASKAKQEQTIGELTSLVEQRADVNYRSEEVGWVSLMYACEYSVPTRVIQALIELKADIDSANDSRKTALHAAASKGNCEVVAILLGHNADATIPTLSGETALTGCKWVNGMTPEQIDGLERCRELLCENRMPWAEFVVRVEKAEADGLKAVSEAALAVAFPEGASLQTMLVPGPDGGKRISRHDRLRLREQIIEGASVGGHGELWRRGMFSSRHLRGLLRAASRPSADGKEPCAVCKLFARYLLLSGAAHFRISELKEEAHRILQEFAADFAKEHSKLKLLPGLTNNTAECYVGFAAQWSPYNERPLHQWHAHGDLPWLLEQNCVGAFEALIDSEAVPDEVGFCGWVGSLRARLLRAESLKPSLESLRSSRIGNSAARIGTAAAAWDPLLPDIFWGEVYTQFLLGEAARAKPVFDRVVVKLVQSTGLMASAYKPAPNKNYVRVVKKQVDYATIGFLAMHQALDLMPGFFSQAVRADLQANSKSGVAGTDLYVKTSSTSYKDAASLVIGEVSSDRKLESTLAAVKSVSQAGEGSDNIKSNSPVVVLLTRGASHTTTDFMSVAEEAVPALLEAGADAVVMQPEDPNALRETLWSGLQQAFQNKASNGEATPKPDALADDQNAGGEGALSNASHFQELLQGEPPAHGFNGEERRLLFELRKNHTGNGKDLLCAGGLLDLVRGSITCQTEGDMAALYGQALRLTIQKDGAEVVRVKNGFKAPVAGGYSDLKVFMLVCQEDEGDSSRLCHICELQMHLPWYLHQKSHSHLPYVIDRGDHDEPEDCFRERTAEAD